MNWLKSWVTTPEQRVTENIQQIISKKALPESDWQSLFADISSPEIPPTLLGGIPGLIEVIPRDSPEGQLTTCNLLTTLAKAATNPQHAAVLIETDTISVLWGLWTKETPQQLVVELLSALRNLLLAPAGGEKFAQLPGALARLFAELEGPLASKVEIKVHLLCVLANLLSTNEFSAFQCVQTHFDSVASRLSGGTSRYAVGVLYNCVVWENCRTIVRQKHQELVQGALVKALGDVVKEPCEGKSMEFCMASRVHSMLDGAEMTPKPAKFPWTYQPIFSGGILE
eukprot:TRINITY_DN6564_c0_g1_i1.p1 TRINITY_DN6564_c0_g1~~TRINITY_DN6564_c0_g1_i1.p1  ORF type:complete len:298 (+),score=83.68 TRINITY_DN6564_c0_g1_i1:45-896(+)